MNVLTSLAPFCDEYFLDLKGNIAIEKFHSFKCTIGFISFWHLVRLWKDLFNESTAVIMSKLRLLSTDMEAKHYMISATDNQ